jgi:hypothetical protein
MDGWQDWLSLTGLILSVGGLGVTLWGLDSLAHDLFPNRPLPHRQAWAWVKRHNPFRKSHTTDIRIGGATATLGIAASARGTATRGRPAADAPPELWVDYWESHIEALGKRIDWLTEDLRKASTDLSERLSQERAERVAADDALAEKVRSWLGGEGGKGLTIAWCGIGVTILGTILQGIAGIGS